MSTAAASEVVAALGRALRKRGVPWYLFGAQAVIYWGRPRLSADVDITIFLPIEEAPSLAAGLRSPARAPADRPAG